MKEYKIEVAVDEKGNLTAETFGMQGKICAEELDQILAGIEGEREVKNSGDYYKSPSVKQTVRR